MKTLCIILFCLTLPAHLLLAQPTQAEIDKMMKDAKAEIEKLKNDPKTAEAAKNMPDMDSMGKVLSKNGSFKNQTTIKTTHTKDPKKDSTQFNLAEKNITFLNSLPIRTFNKNELVSYLHNLNAKVSELLRNGYKTDISTTSETAVGQTGSSIALWLDRQVNESLLIALKGAELNPDNITLLNNAGGILTAAGLGVNAIPVLQYVLEQQPGNNLILNNLGQAYFALGDHNKAEAYLLQCVKSSVYFPDANFALGYINAARGNKDAAIKYTENSLRGAYNHNAYNLLHKLRPDAKLMDYVRHRYKQPEYFNYHKYPILPQCMTVDEAYTLKPQYEALNKMLSEVSDKYRRMGDVENEISKKTSVDIVMEANKKNRNPHRPFGMFANAVLIDLWINEYLDRFLQFGKYKENYIAEKKALRISYEAEIKAILQSGGSCEQRDAVANTYLPKYAILQLDFQLKAIQLYNDYLNDMSYWTYIGSLDDHGFKSAFYGYVTTMIGVLKDINTREVILPCGKYQNEKETAEEIKIEDPDCFLNPRIVLPLGVIKLEISCEAYKLEAGEGLVGKIEYNRFTSDMTIAFGVGGAVPKVFFKGMGAEIGIEAEAKSQFFITVDKSAHISDMGVLWEAELKGVIGVGEVKGEIGYGEGLTAGFGSGVQMKDGGPLKHLIDKTYYVQPDAKQINKNLPLYKK